MKRFLWLLLLLAGFAICFTVSAAAESGTAVFYDGETQVSSVPRNADGSVLLAGAPDTGARKFICWVLKEADGSETLHLADTPYTGTAEGDLRFDALTVSLRTLGGAAVSCNAPAILRFDGAIPKSDYQRLLSLAGADHISFGMLIAPYRGTGGKVFDKSNAPQGTLDRAGVPFLYTTDDWCVFSGKSDEIADSALLEKYCARAYLTVCVEGQYLTVYADYQTESHTRSAHGVTAAAFMDRATNATGTHAHQTDAGCYSPYDGTTLAALRTRLDKVVYISILDEGSVQNKYSRDHYTFFTYDCRGEDGQIIHNAYSSPYKVERVIRNEPAGYDTYVITALDGADFNHVSAYYIGGSYRAPDRAEWREDGIYIAVEHPKS